MNAPVVIQPAHHAKPLNTAESSQKKRIRLDKFDQKSEAKIQDHEKLKDLPLREHFVLKDRAQYPKEHEEKENFVEGYGMAWDAVAEVHGEYEGTGLTVSKFVDTT